MKFKKSILATMLSCFFLSGCSHLTPNLDQKQIPNTIEEIKDDQTHIKFAEFDHNGVYYAAKASYISKMINGYLGKKSGKDCSGFVSLINKKNNNIYFKEANLEKFYTKYGFKSEAIFNLYKNQDMIFQENPKVGDLIFFNNTTSKTKNYKKTKIITHIGIVSDIYSDGTIEFIHHSGKESKKGVINFSQKNKHKAGGKKINSYVVSCKKCSSTYLSSNRFAGFGRVKI